MANTYGIVRLDRVSDASVDGRLKAKVALENGCFGVQDEVNGEVKLASALTDRMVLVASICNQYDSMNEGDFTNKVGKYVRTYDLRNDNIITTTGIVYAGLVNCRADFASIVVGDVASVVIANGKLAVSTDVNAPVTSIKFEVIGKTKLNGDNAIQLKRIA